MRGGGSGGRGDRGREAPAPRQQQPLSSQHREPTHSRRHHNDDNAARRLFAIWNQNKDLAGTSRPTTSMRFVEYTPGSAFPPGEHVLRAVQPFEDCFDRTGQPAFRLTLVNDDGLPLTVFASRRFGPGSTLRAVLEAAAGQRLPLRADVDACVGQPFRAGVVAHPTSPNIRRLGWVSAMDGTLRSVIRASGGQTWLELAEKAGAA